MNILMIAVGGAAGSIMRYGFQKAFSTSFPIGTLAVNIMGCFFIGLLLATLKQSDEEKRLLLMTGFCGGFTTFSAFTMEAIQMMTTGRWIIFSLYIFASVAGGLLATYLGYKILN